MIPTFKHFSNDMDAMDDKAKKPHSWLLTKTIQYLLVKLVLLIVEEAKGEVEFDRKYKTVVKKNWLGFKSYEYHERDENEKV